MGTRTTALLILALLTSGAAVFLIKSLLSAPDAVPAQVVNVVNKETVQVLVAQSDMPSGTFIKSDTTEWLEWPKSNIQENFINRSASEQMMGSVVTRAFVKGEPINARHVLKVGDKGYLVAVLGAGMRAISVPVSVTSGNAGFITPGDRIDLLLVRKLKTSESSSNTFLTGETVLENIRVLAVDQTSDDLSKKAKLARSLTLEVTPKQAEMIAVANELGIVNYTLRGLVPDGKASEGNQKIVAAAAPEKTPISTISQVEEESAPAENDSAAQKETSSKVDDPYKVLDIEPARVPNRQAIQESDVSNAQRGMVRVLKGKDPEMSGR